MIVNAPVNSFDYILDNHQKFHNHVMTHAIAHELGHALARLQDEYDSHSNSKHTYASKLRNIDNSDINPKWQKIIDAGYGGGNATNNLIGTCQGAYYNPTKYYRPSEYCTMRSSRIYKVQFCPVCTYHLEATFKIRTSVTDPNVKDQTNDENPNNFEWKHYSIDDFTDDWSSAIFAKTRIN